MADMYISFSSRVNECNRNKAGKHQCSRLLCTEIKYTSLLSSLFAYLLDI